MDYDSESSCEERLLDLEGRKHANKKSFHTKRIAAPLFYGTDIYSASDTTTQNDTCPKTSTSKVVERTLSSQVKEYYNKYSQNSNLDRYFSHPDANLKNNCYEYRWRSRTDDLLDVNEVKNLKDEQSLINDIPKERRRWIRPPLIGQPSGASNEALASSYAQKDKSNNQTSSPESESKKIDDTNPTDDKNKDTKKNDSYTIEIIERATKTASPTSSVTSHKPLEWDSGADVGYALSTNKDKNINMLSTIERMIYSKDLCTSELRMDPEGTTGSIVDQAGVSKAFKSPSINDRHSKPNANSTRIVNDQTESEEEIEITPIVKPNMPGIITGNIIVEESDSTVGITDAFSMKKNTQINEKSIGDTPKIPTKYATEKILKSKFFKDFQCDSSSMRVKSASMNILGLSMSSSTVPLLTRSQSELNLDGKNKKTSQLPLNFASSSSIATIVNKPLTCDKDIQTNFDEQMSLLKKESVGVQVSTINTTSSSNHDPKSQSDDEANNKKINKNNTKTGDDKDEEKKPPLPERISSLGNNNNKLQSILKNSDVQTKKDSRPASSQSERQEETTTASDAGRASNSFEYFPGHIYQNVLQSHSKSTSRVSSVDTGLSHSTMPNTSSSIDGKLWGGSNNLVRDLERSVNILKLLVNANKCDKHVKKRLIHHVIKRLVTAKYTDDKIEHNLEENVPWNPDNARNKVYRADIIQALAKKQNNTNNNDTSEESSDDWKPRKRSSSLSKKINQNDEKKIMEMVRLVVSSENSDLFEERNTDSLQDGLQDGRTARMGLRPDDHQLHQRHRDKRVQKNSLNINTDKSESSEGFLSNQKIIDNNKNKILINEKINKTSTTTIASSNSDDKEIINKKKDVNKMDWRLPVTMSERQFELERSSYRAGVSSKLIDYVQMEKKNQLVWINNEINHLSCLKKLLEEPKRYTPDSPLLFDDKKNLSDDNSIDYLRKRELSKQWSSHGNLAVRQDKDVSKKITTKSQNCHVQTKITSSDDIESNNHHSRKSTSVSSIYEPTFVDASSTPVWSPRRHCTIHGNKKNSCTCSKKISSSLELLPTNTKKKTTDNSKLTAVNNSKKDTKNRLNDRCKSEVNITEYQAQYSTDKKSSKHCKSCRCSSSTNTFNKNQIKQKIENKINKQDDDDGTDDTDGTDGTDGTNDTHDTHESDECTCNKVQGVRSCRVCGTLYSSSRDRKCKCVQTYVKPVAYEISFDQEKIKKPLRKKKEKSSQCRLSSAECSGSEQAPLQDYLTKNKPDFVDKIDKRQRCMTELTQLRQLKKEKRNQYLSMTSPSDLIIPQKIINPPVTSTRKISDEEMKNRLRMRYLRLNEVKLKRQKKDKEEQARRNHLMAKIYCKKLQQKVLKGQVDLSQSVSVISNL
ncbi:uncharacterized protein LOC122855657 [Aphidius gifuensis]|uniref:uncharacterized protein LOC122855657 n=1 Tax=Aphidius gifuensis TaxID=684658 RepID=UPI001CDCBA59|nr:uncharacterized protein LOC122855657 [Aphidius gifuensis]